jgi:Arc/MetJ-type ribon-helix-helix transcriptional regulator
LFLDRQGESGRFASVEDAIREAVALLEHAEEDHLDGWKLDELRRAVRESEALPSRLT